MTVKLYLKDPKKKESIIVAQILWRNFQLRYTTKRKIETKYWIAVNDKKEAVQRVKKTSAYPLYAEINQALDNIIHNISKVFIRFENENQGMQPHPSLLKQLLDIHLNRIINKLEEVKPLSFVQFVEDFIRRSEKGVRNNHKTGTSLSKNTLNTYRTLLKHLKSYEDVLGKRIDWEDINLDFHSNYTEYLMHELDLANNTVGKDFQIIKVICSEAHETGENKFMFYNNKLFSVLRESSFAIYFDEEEIKLLWSLDLSQNRRYEETRDLFIFACQTGLRFSDFSKIQDDKIINKEIHIRQIKTGKPLAIPLHDLSLAVVNKYQNKLPQSKYIQDFNQDIKNICKMIPAFHKIIDSEISKGGVKVLRNKCKYEMVMSHTPRRSFATNEVRRKTPIPIIRAITGHESEKSFWKYVKIGGNDYTSMYSEILQIRNNLKNVN